MFRKYFIYLAFGTFILYLGLILSLVYFLKPMEMWELMQSKRVLSAVGISLLSASISSLIALIIGIPVGYALSRYQFKGKVFVDSILEIPMIVSPVALGAMLLLFFNNPLGSFVQDKIGQFVFTFYGILLAQFITILGIAVRMMKSVFDEIPSRFEHVARSLGASPFRSFLKVSLPMAKNGLIASVILVWAKALGEFGATITLAGSMAYKTETLPTAIFMKLAVADIPGTATLIAILLGLGLFGLSLIRIFFKPLRYD